MFPLLAIGAEPLRVEENFYGFKHVCIKKDKNDNKYIACFMDKKWALLGKGGDTVWHFHTSGEHKWLQFNNLNNHTSVVHKYTPNCKDGTLDITQTISFSKPRLEGSATNFDESIKRIPAIPGTFPKWILEIHCKN